jgi:hypothetical protein
MTVHHRDAFGREMLELAARCEAATGPDRELDIAMLPLIGLRFVDEGHPIGRVCYDSNNQATVMPRFTASIDAALTLVPEGSLFTTRTLWDRDKVAGFASISRYELAGPDDQLRRYWMDEHQSNAATPPLALCVAALRARSSS